VVFKMTDSIRAPEICLPAHQRQVNEYKGIDIKHIIILWMNGFCYMPRGFNLYS
jgi:hypothetical protein